MELGDFAEEQAALRRVATLVARGTPPDDVFAAVCAEAGRLLDADHVAVSRHDPDGHVTVLAAWTRAGTAPPIPVGHRVELGGRKVTSLALQTGRPTRIDRYGPDADPSAAPVLADGVSSAVGAPVGVEGKLWGVMFVTFAREEPPPTGIEARLAEFAELAGTAIANAQARVELRRYAEEQAALRRVAMLVAGGAPPDEVFESVTAEVGRLLAVDCTVLSRYDAEGLVTVVGHWASTDPGRPLATGLRLKAEGQNIHARVLETGRSARIDDCDTASGAFADVARDRAFRASVGAPIWVEGRLWGVMSVGSRSEPLPAETEERLAVFTELAATAIANAEAREALTASRARIVAAADAGRRRVERDLHDGAQQRLVALALQLRDAQAAAPPEAAELTGRLEGVITEATGVLEELREIARGLHPAVLTESGLRPALRALARRSVVPVDLDIRVAGRLPEPVEIAAYYAVAEALTNTAKHAQASTAEVEVATGDGVLHVCVRDDGRGGAGFGQGSGLIGLKDRVEALSGRIWLDSPHGSGTAVQIVLPLAPAGRERRADLSTP